MRAEDVLLDDGNIRDPFDAAYEAPEAIPDHLREIWPELDADEVYAR